MFIACLPNEPKENYGKLLAIPSEDMTGKYARYWLASAYVSNYLWNVNEYGDVGYYVSDEFGLRRIHIKIKFAKDKNLQGRHRVAPTGAKLNFAHNNEYHKTYAKL